MKKAATLVIGLLFCTMTYSQEAIDVTDQTVKLGGLQETELQYGFAAGDKILFSFQEVNNKELREIKIIEYPTNSKFSDVKIKQIENKTIFVNQQGVYLFKFTNTALASRQFKVKIQRIPASEDTKNFNTAVTWEERQETTYNTFTKDVLVGHDTTYVQKSRKTLIKTEQKEQSILNQSQTVHSTTNGNGNRTSVSFTLPQNETTPYKTQKVISWAYWVGVNQKDEHADEQDKVAVSNLAKSAASYFTTPLGALAIGAISSLRGSKGGEDVYYALTDKTNRDLFIAGNAYKYHFNGKGSTGYRALTDESMSQGTFYVLFSNDNNWQSIEATLKVVAIVETNIYEDEQYTETIVTPRYEKQAVSEPIVSTVSVPVTGR